MNPNPQESDIFEFPYKAHDLQYPSWKQTFVGVFVDDVVFLDFVEKMPFSHSFRSVHIHKKRNTNLIKKKEKRKRFTNQSSAKHIFLPCTGIKMPSNVSRKCKEKNIINK